jgi:ribosome assembly protein SQT1
MSQIQGKQVSPADIEAQLITHAAVQEAAVIGVAHEDAGERAQAYICLGKSAADKSEDDVRQSIREFIEQRMAQEYWLGNRIVFVDKIPRTLSGKVLKETLKEWAREGRTGHA